MLEDTFIKNAVEKNFKYVCSVINFDSMSQLLKAYLCEFQGFIICIEGKFVYIQISSSKYKTLDEEREYSLLLKLMRAINKEVTTDISVGCTEEDIFRGSSVRFDKTHETFEVNNCTSKMKLDSYISIEGDIKSVHIYYVEDNEKYMVYSNL